VNCRSQAPPEIRHVSGQHISEFRSFLDRFPDTFKIDNNENVMLKEFENEVASRSAESDAAAAGASEASSPPPSSVDKEKILQLIEFYGTVLKDRGGPMIVEQLFHIAAGNHFADFIKSPNDLKSFFQIHPQCFQVRLH
jgi:exonuclease 3'-5' domain-containing protein 1